MHQDIHTGVYISVHVCVWRYNICSHEGKYFGVQSELKCISHVSLLSFTRDCSCSCVALVAPVCLVFDHCVRLDPKSFEASGNIFMEAAGLRVCLMWLCNQNWHGKEEGHPPFATGVDVTSNHGQQHKETEGIIAMEISQEAEWFFPKFWSQGFTATRPEKKKFLHLWKRKKLRKEMLAPLHVTLWWK